LISRVAKTLWARPLTLDEIRRRYLGGCDRHLGVELTAIGPDWLEGRMPATERTRDPYGDNYACAIAILGESLGSIAANLCLAGHFDLQELRVAANILGVVKDGFPVTIIARAAKISSFACGNVVVSLTVIGD